MSRPGILIVGHGTRDADGVAEFLTLVQMVQERLPDVAVEPAFLELARPTIAEGLQSVVARGADDLRVAPLLLFAAGHMKRDIPEALAAAARDYPRIRCRLVDCLGCDRRVVELSTRRFQEAIANSDIPLSETALFMIGRGSVDPDANAEMYRFARMRYEATPTGWLEVAFTAMTTPGLEEGVRLASGLPFRQVVAQPHLLFSGQLFQRIRDLVAQQSRTDSKQFWICTRQLGPDASLVSAICERCGF